MTVCLPFSKTRIFDRKPENWIYFAWIYLDYNNILLSRFLLSKCHWDGSD